MHAIILVWEGESEDCDTWELPPETFSPLDLALEVVSEEHDYRDVTMVRVLIWDNASDRSHGSWTWHKEES